MVNKGYTRFLNKNFKNSECMEFLDTIVDKYQELFYPILWKHESYERKKNGVSINYTYDNDIIVDIKSCNTYIGNLSFIISRYHNNITIYDNMNHYSESNSNITNIVMLRAYADGKSIVSFSKYSNYGTKYQTLIDMNKISFDSNGNLIEYLNKDNISSIRNEKAIYNKYKSIR